MKLQYLAVIFVIIIMPIVMILSQYIDYHIDAITLRRTYDTKLVDSTYDAIKAYQLNTVNNAISDISAAKIEDLEASVKTFYNSIQTTFGYTGYNSSSMKIYVPAIVFTMYDGYYIYSPYQNVLTNVNVGVDPGYLNNEIHDGIKPYVYYSCRYKINDDNDFIITYTLDNYITVQGTVGGEYVNRSGYLIGNISSTNSNSLSDDDWTKSEDDYTYTYDGISFDKDSKEKLTEYLGNTEYYYAKLNGTKYYLSKSANESSGEVFYINASGEKSVQVSSSNNSTLYKKYFNFITNNNSAYKYYRESYIFTKWVEKKLGSLSTSNAMIGDGTETEPEPEVKEKAKKIFGDQNIFENCTTTNIQDSDSPFNAHRSAVIRYTIESNLSTSIAAYKNYYNNNQHIEYKMPNISETDWEILENNVSVITFLQGFTVGGREYNKYCVVANNLTKEYVDEDDIYFLGNDKTYYKVNDTTLDDSKITERLGKTTDSPGYVPGIWKLNFERKNYKEVIGGSGTNQDNYETRYYYPISYENSGNPVPYIGSYSSIIASTSVDNSKQDLYKYMRESVTSDKLKTVYYTALARERYGQYSVNKDIDIKPGENIPPNAPNEDETPPKVEIKAKQGEEDYNEEWTKEDITIVGTAEDDGGIARYAFYRNGGKFKENTTSNNNSVTETHVEEETGEYIYKFWAKDTSGNSDTTSKEITIKIDKVEPKINISGNETEGWNKNNVPITVTLSDEHSGLSGYVITDNNEESSDDKYIKLNDQELKNLDLNLTISDDGSDEGQESTIKSGSFIHVMDKAGNVFSKKISAEIDKTPPIVTATPESSEFCKNIEIEITLSDNLSGVKEDKDENGNIVSRRCYLLKNKETNKTEYKEYEYKCDESGKAKVKIGEGLTGEYELWIESVSDNVGNETGKTYIGIFKFDNEAPTITVEPITANLRQNLDVAITATDNQGGSGLKSQTGTYYLSTSQSENTKSVKGTYVSGEKFNIAIDNSTGDPLTGTYYLWVGGDITDKAGNTTQLQQLGGPYKFDNQAPTIQFKLKETSTINSIAVETLATEHGEAGIASFEYYIKASQDSKYSLAGKNESESSTDSFVYTENIEVGKTYSVYVKVIDKVGNESISNVIEVKLADNYMITTGNNKQYKPTLADAISVATDNSKITLLKSIEDNSVATIDNITNLIFDLHGNILTRNTTITITDTSTVSFRGNGYIKTNNETDKSIITNGGTCNIEFDENYGIIHNATNYADLKNLSQFVSRSAINNIGTVEYKSGKITQQNAIAINLNDNATINMIGGEISYGYFGIVSQGRNTTININDGLIQSNGKNSKNYGIAFVNLDNTVNATNNLALSLEGNTYINNNNKLTVKGGKIISNENAAIGSIRDNPTIELLGGEVLGAKYGMHVMSNLAIKVPEVIVGDVNSSYSNEVVKISGGENAMCMDTSEGIQAFNVYFYNGILKTTTPSKDVLSGAYIQQIRQAYSIIDDKDALSHYKNLVEVGNDATFAVGNNTYTTLNKAVAAADNKDTIVLLKDGTDGSDVEINKDITLLLNNYTLTRDKKKISTDVYSGPINIGQTGTLTITGNDANIIRQTSTQFTYFNVSGKFKLYGKVSITTDKNSNNIIETAAEGAIIDINNGILSATVRSKGDIGDDVVVYIKNDKSTCYIRGDTNITLGEMGCAIYNTANETTINLEGGLIYCNWLSSQGIYNTSNMNCYLNGTDMKVYEQNSTGIYSTRTSSGNIYSTKDGTEIMLRELGRTSAKGIYIKDYSTVNIIMDAYVQIFNANDYTANNAAFMNVAIYNSGSGEITINDGFYMGKVHGIRSNGKITINGGTIGQETYGRKNSSDYALYR